MEHKIPLPYSQPDDLWPEGNGNIGIKRRGQRGALIKFDPDTEECTYYPSPQRTDMPKLAIARDGAIWYNPRSSGHASVGVLYPDATEMTTLAAYY